MDAAIKLRKLDPLILVVAANAVELGLSVSVEPIRNVISDLAGAGGAGIFRIATIRPESGGKAILLNAVAVHEGNGDHKSKEWGARRLASLYRIQNGDVGPSEYQDGMFVLDGEWEDKDVARLYRAGWNHICRLGDLEKTLRKVFELKGKSKVREVKPALLSLEEGDEDT